MARGSSGRVVVEAGPQLKKRLYTVLSAQGLTLKDWFIQAAETQISQHEQPPKVTALQTHPPKIDVAKES